MKRLGLLAILIVLSTSYAATLKPMGAEHAREMKKRTDGKFDVVCVDGETEVRTQEEVSAGVVCIHIEQKDRLYKLSSGGIEDSMRFCDLNIKRLMSRDRILKLEAGFVEPCDIPPNRTEDCNGLLCNLRLGETFYSFEFTTDDRLTLIRLKDGLTAKFGIGGTGSGRVRVTELLNKSNILQVQDEEGAWASVCDDAFDANAAAVACREMGFESVDSFETVISIANDENYGMDDVRCDGTEASLFDCEHITTGENCNFTEHVVLNCTN